MRLENEVDDREGADGVDVGRSASPHRRGGFVNSKAASIPPQGREAPTSSGTVCRLPPIDTATRHSAPSTMSSQYSSSLHTPPHRIPLFKSNSVPCMLQEGLNLAESSVSKDGENGSGPSFHDIPRPSAGRHHFRNLLDSPSFFMREHETRFGIDGVRSSYGPAYHDMSLRRRPSYALVERKTWDSNRHLSRISPYKDTRGDRSESPGYRGTSAFPHHFSEGWDWSSRAKDPTEFRRYHFEPRYSRMPSRQYRSWPGSSSLRRESLSGDIRSGSGLDDHHHQRYGRNAGHLYSYPNPSQYSTNPSFSQTRLQDSSMYGPDHALSVHASPYDGSCAKSMDGHVSVSPSEFPSPRPMKHEYSAHEKSSQSLSPKDGQAQEQDKRSSNAKNGGAASNDQPAPKRGGKLPRHITDMLKTWLLDHADHPYPTEEEKRAFCDFTGLDICQISNWFVNARRRILVPAGARTAATATTAASSATATD